MRLNEYKSIGQDNMHSRVLKELTDVVANPLSIIFEKSCLSRKVPDYWQRKTSLPFLKKR